MVTSAPTRTKPDSAPVLATEHLGMRFGKQVVALEDVSITIGRDDFVIVLGPSGAGKSTLLRSLNRLNRPTSGRVLFDGQDVTHASGASLRRLRQNVGMIFQQFNLVGRRSVLQNVLAGRLRFADGPLSLPLSLASIFSREDRDLAFAALERVGIQAKAYERADNLSGGQQQRVAIARLIAQQPRVVLADEPIASLDPASAQVVMQLLSEMHQRDRIPILVNLHQVDVARQYAKRIIGMSAGKVIFDGPPNELTTSLVRELYHGNSQTPAHMQDASTESVHDPIPTYPVREY